MKHKVYPFTVMAETKTSKAGNEYLSIGVAMTKKDQQGNYDSTWFNMIDKRDLLVLANTCNEAFNKIVESEADSRDKPAYTKPAAVTEDAPFNDDSDSIPF